MTISGKTFATVSQIASQLTTGYWVESGRTARKFDITSSGTLVVDLTGLDSKGLAAARQALQAWTDASGIKFSEYVPGSGATVNILFGDDYAGAYSSSAVRSGTILKSYVNISPSFSSGAYFLQTYIHEIGHALGLGHSGNYNGSGTFSADAMFANDTWQYSIMSYFSQEKSPDTDASRLYVITPQIADVQAIQNLYGVSTAVHGGDTTYGTGGVAITVDRAQTIVDGSGIDTIDLRAASANQSVDLNDGAFSNIGGYRGNLAIAQGTMIENALLGAGNDKLIGNELANILSSGAGADSVNGGAGNDTITGGAGNDTLTGGAGADIFAFGTGFGADTITDFGSADFIDISAISSVTSWSAVLALMSQSALGVSIATLEGSILLSGLTISALSSALFVLFDTGIETPVVVPVAVVVTEPVTVVPIEPVPSFVTVTLTEGADKYTVSGEAAASDLNILGAAGNDTITAGSGDDTVTGGAGSDKIVLGLGNDRFIDETDAGIDTVYGGAGNDVLTSLGGRDVLYGDDGDDVLTASAAGSALSGGLGNDTFTGGAGADIITDAGGNDRADLGAGNDKYSGSGDSAENRDTVYGGAGNDTIYGGVGNGLLDGGADNDYIDAGSGDDTVSGGAGNDLIVLGLGDDRFVDGTDAGVDTVYGGSGNNVLISLGGRDLLYGGDGNDVLTASDDGSALSGGLGNDTFTGGAGADSVIDAGGNDRVDLGAGNDKYSASGDSAANGDNVLGGAGNDTLIASSGNDTIQGGADNDLISAGAGDDLVYGGTGNDTLMGGAGNDRLYAGAGSDVLSGAEGSDVFVFASTDGVNRITDFTHGVDRIDLSGLDGLAGWADLSSHLRQSGTSVLIDFDTLDITLSSATVSGLTASDFLL